MFSHRLPYNDLILFRVEFEEYAEKHYLKDLSKKYPAKNWNLTVDSIRQDLSRMRTTNSTLQQSMQVDQLWYKNQYCFFKYDFRVAGTKESTKSSGNRLVAFLDIEENVIKILLIYHKKMLPKNQSETTFIKTKIAEQYPHYWEQVH